MKFVKPENSNMTFGAGDNPSTGSLDVTMCYRRDIPGRLFSISEWELTDEELAEIIRTRRVYLSVMGPGMMPVNILAFNPFEHYGYYEAVVTDTPEGKRITDPEEMDSYSRWMDLVRAEIESRDFFKIHMKNPFHYAPGDTWLSMFRAGTSFMSAVNSLERWIEHKTKSQN